MQVRASPRQAASIVSGDFLMTAKDFEQIAQYLHADSGILMNEHKADLVYSRLTKRLRVLGLTTFRDYCKLVANAEGIDERQKMVAALTTNITAFFREPHHFEHLSSKVLPNLIAAAKRGQPIRIWSAGCSSGEEPYSIALSVLALLPEALSLDIRILATDLDHEILARASEATFTATSLEAVPAGLRRRFFNRSADKMADRWRLSDDVCDLVHFRQLSLFADWPLRRRYQAIFCRNVAIYFEQHMQSKLWSRFADQLDSEDTLYIGHSERLSGPATAAFQNAGITTWRKIEGARS